MDSAILAGLMFFMVFLAMWYRRPKARLYD